MRIRKNSACENPRINELSLQRVYFSLPQLKIKFNFSILRPVLRRVNLSTVAIYVAVSYPNICAAFNLTVTTRSFLYLY